MRNPRLTLSAAAVSLGVLCAQSPALAQRNVELAKWDSAGAHLPRSGPGGTEWDSQYRSFIQTDENATSKGLPTHADAAKQIKADAAKSAANLQKHKGWARYIKHFSQPYRPDVATAALKQLYEDLVAMEFGATPSATPTAAPLPFEGDARLTIHRDVVYGKSHPASQILDAYLVKADKPTPLVIEIHGGGWRRGSKSQFVYQGDLIGDIVSAGISVVSIDYRLTPQHPLPAQTEDVTRAVQFVRSNAKEWNVDPTRITALGGSAGAHLAAWVALHDDLVAPASADPVERLSSRLAGFVALSGPMDLTRVRPSELSQQNLRGQDFAGAFTAACACTAEQYEHDSAVRQLLRQASPLFLVSVGDPPAFVMGAAAQELAEMHDAQVPAVINDPHSAWQSVLLVRAMQRARVPVVARIGPQVGKNPASDNAAIVTFLREAR